MGLEDEGRLRKRIAALEIVMEGTLDTRGPLSTDARKQLTAIMMEQFYDGQESAEHTIHDLKRELQDCQRTNERRHIEMRNMAREMSALRQRVREYERKHGNGGH